MNKYLKAFIEIVVIYIIIGIILAYTVIDPNQSEGIIYSALLWPFYFLLGN